MNQENNVIRPYEITSLPPGFIIVRIPRDRFSLSNMLRIKPADWEILQRQGYSGGIILDSDTEVESLDEKLMNDLGWYRK